MAINKNESHENAHTVALGMSGSGKTHFLTNHPELKPKTATVIAFDAYETHNVPFTYSIQDFGQKLAQHVANGKPYRLGLSVEPTTENFEAFCSLVWLALDGNKVTNVIVGELADVSKPGKASPSWGQMVRVGRKFGLRLFVESQRPQEIDKTIFTQSPRKWVGYLEPFDHGYVEKYVGLPKGCLASIELGSYKCFYKKGTQVQQGGKGKKINV